MLLVSFNSEIKKFNIRSRLLQNTDNVRGLVNLENSFVVQNLLASMFTVEIYKKMLENSHTFFTLNSLRSGFFVSIYYSMLIPRPMNFHLRNVLFPDSCGRR